MEVIYETQHAQENPVPAPGHLHDGLLRWLYPRRGRSHRTQHNRNHRSYRKHRGTHRWYDRTTDNTDATTSPTEETQTPTEPTEAETEPPATESHNTDPTFATEVPTESPVETFVDVVETVYAISTVNVRSGPSTDDMIVGSLSYGESVQRTGIGNKGWSRVDYNGEEAYVYASYLSTTNPA